MTKEAVIDILAEQSTMETTIECGNGSCIISASEYSDELGAAKYFYRIGWRVDKDNLPMCPKCVKKLNEQICQ